MRPASAAATTALLVLLLVEPVEPFWGKTNKMVKRMGERVREHIKAQGAKAVAIEDANKDAGTFYWAGHDPLGKAAKHVPQVTVEKAGQARTATITVPHGMDWSDGSKHIIDALFVRDQTGKLIHFRELTEEDTQPSSSFTVPKDVTAVTAYEHCNLHGLWKSALVPLPDAELR